VIAAKEAAMKTKRNTSKALNGFEGKGLTVEQRNGKHIKCFLSNYFQFRKLGCWYRR